VPISPFGPERDVPRPLPAEQELDWATRLFLHDPRFQTGLMEAKRAEAEYDANTHGKPDAPFRGVIPTTPRYLDFGKDHVDPEAPRQQAIDPPNLQEEGKRGEHDRPVPNMLEWMRHFMSKLLPQP
jgi:hypothetical protein